MLLVLAVAYVALTTVDVALAGVPLKVPTVGAALLAWLWARESRPHPGDYLVSWSVVGFGVVVPVVWLAVALRRADGASDEVVRYALQESSRFTYVLLFFPLIDWIERHRDGHRIWLVPVFALCGLTWAFYLGHAVLGIDFGQTGQVGPFRGAIAVDATGVFRSYLIDDVLFIPALGLVLGRIAVRGLDGRGLLELTALLTALYLAHTRGLWLAVSVAVVSIAAALMPWPARARPALPALLLAGYIALLFANAAPHAVRDVVSPLLDRNELSLSQRLDQGDELWAAFTARPAVGSGMGATLPSGFRRNEENPWSFELTWLQLLFQLGVAGVALVLAAPILAAARTLRAVRGADRVTRLSAAAAVGSLAGFLLACASNPYLTTSVGTLCLAILLAMCHDAIAARRTLSVRPDPHRA